MRSFGGRYQIEKLCLGPLLYFISMFPSNQTFSFDFLGP